jgi:hypothetical protein
VKKIYGTRNKGLQLVAYSRDDKKFPIVIKIDRSKEKITYFFALTKKQSIRLSQEINAHL